MARAQELEPDSARLFLVEAAHHRAHERIADAEAALVRALDCASAEDGPILRWRLAAFYGQCERYSEAADLFEEVVGGDVSHSGAIPLLVSLRNGGRLRAALDWARAIRAQHPNPYKVALETEAHILNQVGDVEAAAARWGDICIRDDATETDHLRHAQALLWAGERDEAAEKVREIDASALADEPKQLLALAQIKCLLGEQEYLRDAYAARRGGVDDPSIHMGYFALFMTLDARMSAPEVVEPGCAVLLRNEFGDQWWLVVEHGEDTPGDHELHPDTDLAKSLLGRGRGETVVHQEGMGAKSSEVVEIQNRYVRAFQETTAEFPTRFPGNADLTSIPVKADDFAEFLGIVDEADRLARDLMQLYRDDHVPFASLCQRLARPALPDIWRACTTSDDVRLRFGRGTVQEAEEAAEALRSCDTITLDMLSLLTAHALGIEEHLRRRFGRVRVPQQVLDSLRTWVYEATLGSRQQATLGRNIDGTYTYIEMTDDAWAERQGFARSVLELAESFEPIAAYPALEADPALLEIMGVALTQDAVGALFAGDEGSGDQPILVSDDLIIAELAQVYGIRGVNTQAVLRELRRAEVVTDEEYSSLIGRLAQLNYRFIQVTADDILRRLEAHGFMTDEATRALLVTLQGPECTQESAVFVVSDLIAQIGLKNLPPDRITTPVTEIAARALRACYRTVTRSGCPHGS